MRPDGYTEREDAVKQARCGEPGWITLHAELCTMQPCICQPYSFYSLDPRSTVEILAAADRLNRTN